MSNCSKEPPLDEVQVLREVVERDLYCSQSWVDLGKSYYQSKDYQSSIGIYNSSLKYVKSPVLLYGLAKSYFRSGMYKEAQNLLIELKGTENEHRKKYGILLYLGLAFYCLSDFNNAIGAFNDAVGFSMNNFDKMKAFCYLGSAYLDRKDYAKATEAFRLGLDSCKCPQSLGCAAWVLFKQQSIKQAIDLLSASPLVSHKDHSIIDKLKYILVLCLIEEGMYSDAFEMIQNILSRFNSDYKYWSVCGIIYAKVKQYTDAVQCFMKADELFPKNPEILFNLGFTYQSNNEYSNATELYNKVSSLTNERRILFSDYIYPDMSISLFLFEQTQSCDFRILKCSPLPMDISPLSMTPKSTFMKDSSSNITANDAFITPLDIFAAEVLIELKTQRWPIPTKIL